MDIRTWQDADRADDARTDDAGPGSPAKPSHRARHRSSRSPFSPLRPAPIAIGSLSTAAVAAVALVSPHLLHAEGTASASPAIDGRAVPAGHIAPRTPGPAGATSAPATANQGPVSTAGSTGGPAAPTAPPSANPSTATAGAKQTPAHQPSSLPSSTAPTPSASSDPTGGSVDQGRTDPGAPPSSSGRVTPTSAPSSAPSTPVTPPSTPVTPPPTTPTSAPAAFNAAAAQQSALTEIAAVRHTNGIDQLSVDGVLTTLAAQHDADMVKNHYFSHSGSDGSSPLTRALRANCWTFGKEIIARGAPGTDVIAALLADPQAGQALTWGWYSTIGVSAQQDPATGQVLWTIELGWG